MKKVIGKKNLYQFVFIELIAFFSFWWLIAAELWQDDLESLASPLSEWALAVICLQWH